MIPAAASRSPVGPAISAWTLVGEVEPLRFVEAPDEHVLGFARALDLHRERARRAS